MKRLGGSFLDLSAREKVITLESLKCFRPICFILFQEIRNQRRFSLATHSVERQSYALQYITKCFTIPNTKYGIHKNYSEYRIFTNVIHKKKPLIIYTIFEKSFVYFSGLNFISNNHHLIVKTRNEQNISAIHPSIWLKTGRGFSQTTYVDLFCQEHGPSFHLQLYILPVSIHSSRVPWQSLGSPASQILLQKIKSPWLR